MHFHFNIDSQNSLKRTTKNIFYLCIFFLIAEKIQLLVLKASSLLEQRTDPTKIDCGLPLMEREIPLVDREREIKKLDNYLKHCYGDGSTDRKQFPSVVIATTPGMGKVH